MKALLAWLAFLAVVLWAITTGRALAIIFGCIGIVLLTWAMLDDWRSHQHGWYRKP